MGITFDGANINCIPEIDEFRETWSVALLEIVYEIMYEILANQQYTTP